MKRLMIIGLWPDDVVKYCTEKCDCRRYACRNHKPEILLRLRPEHAEAHMGPGQALLHDVRRAG